MKAVKACIFIGSLVALVVSTLADFDPKVVYRSGPFEEFREDDEHEELEPNPGWYRSHSKDKGFRFDSEVSMTESKEEEQKRLMSALGRQLMLTQFALEERVRSDGGSGIKQIRVMGRGTRPYHAAHHSNRKRWASIHEHSNNIRTVGMGEFIGVLNGVEFRTRHNDYRLKQPHVTSGDFHATQEIEFPPVPEDVTSKEGIDAQVEEMRLWFKAFKDQDYSVRDYRRYFRPVLCYLEGAWTNSGEEIDESFESDRHFLEASSWFDLQEKIRFTSYTGRKNRNENYAYLPTAIMNLVNGTLPVFAQWNYRILCHPLKGDLPLSKLRPADDMAPRFAGEDSWEEYLKSRAARFTLHDYSHDTERPETYTLLDQLMAEIPGKDNYKGNMTDNLFGDDLVLDWNTKEPLNTAYYHRYFKTSGRDAMGVSVRQRGFSDPNLFVATTTQERVAGISLEHCKGRGARRTCTTVSQRVSYAIPLEIIYMTPLNRWNPYNLKYRGEANTEEGKLVTAGGRNGAYNEEMAFDGVNSKKYYITPAELFESAENSDPANTARYTVGVLDQKGGLHRMRSSGTRIFLPNIDGVGSVRQRYPVMPVHGEGSAVWKELETIKDTVNNLKDHIKYLRNPFSLGDQGESSGSTGDKEQIFHTSLSYRNTVEPHAHTVSLTPEDWTSLEAGKEVEVTTSTENGHSHDMRVKLNDFGYLQMLKCDGEYNCWDRHRNVLYPDGKISPPMFFVKKDTEKPLEGTFHTSASDGVQIFQHRHRIWVSIQDMENMYNGNELTVQTVRTAGHTHELVLKIVGQTDIWGNQYFGIMVVSCDAKPTCWDGHNEWVTFRRTL